MGKKRIAKKTGTSVDSAKKARALSKTPKKKMEKGILSVRATYNNTQVTLSDTSGNVACWSSSGALGFKGAKKGTTYAAAKIGEVIGEKAKMMGIKEVDVVVNGVGSGRESAIRAFLTKGSVNISNIKDITPVPHNGPRAPKPRRV